MKTFVAIFLGFAILEMTLADSDTSDSEPEVIIKPDNDLIPPEQNKDITNESIILTLDKLTNKSDPLKLAQEIEKITDPQKRNQLITELNQAWLNNKDTLPGKFYLAAFISIKDPEHGATFWQNELDSSTEYVIKYGTRIRYIRDTGDDFGNFRKIVEHDALKLALLQGDPVLLTVLSDASKKAEKLGAASAMIVEIRVIGTFE